MALGRHGGWQVDGVALKAHPAQLAREGRWARVPLLHGSNLDEGAGFEHLPPDCSKADLRALALRAYGPTMGPLRGGTPRARHNHGIVLSVPSLDAVPSFVC